MVAHEEKFKGVMIGRYNSHDELQKDLTKFIKKDLDEVFFICVGTDRSTGDSLAPLIGTYLKEQGYNNVFGTIDEPVHAENLDEYINRLPKDKTVIAIDACLGRLKNVGTITLNSGELHAGKGVGKNLTPVGDFHIVGIVNISGFMEFHVLQNTRLSTVMKMAKEITQSITTAFPIEQNSRNELSNKRKFTMKKLVRKWGII